MPKVVDARGLPCPQPVISTRKALAEADHVVIIVDNEIAQRNVTRMVEKAGGTVRVEKRDDGIYLDINRGAAVLEQRGQQAIGGVADAGSLVLLVPSELMGRGEHAELGQVLMRGFFHALSEMNPLPNTIIFFNSGVKLVVEGSPVVEDLQFLREQGVEVLACGTCLGYYNLKEKVAVGEVSNMYTIVETMLTAARVITL